MRQGKRLNISLLTFLTVFLIGSLIGCATHPPLRNENAKLVVFKPGAEPDGFGGVKWETQLSTLDGMTHYRRDPSHGGIDFYVKVKNDLGLGEGRFKTIQYGFWKGNFYVGIITTQGLPEWNGLKEAVFDKYGEGSRPYTNRQEFLWVGKDAVMVLRYDEMSKEGVHYIRSDAMRERIESDYPGVF